MSQFKSAVDNAESANAAATATISAIPNGIINARNVVWSYSGGAPTGGKLTLQSWDGSTATALAEFDITAAGPGALNLDGFKSKLGEALRAVLAAGGAGVTGKVSLAAEFG